MLNFPEASFSASAWQPSNFPPDAGAEVAFAGRSNAGKSSALNAITGRKDLARTSKTPGRTQLINFFALADGARWRTCRATATPKCPSEMKQHWRRTHDPLRRRRASLAGLVIVMDARRPLTDFDQQMLEWVRSARLCPPICLLTKADKLSRSEATHDAEAGARRRSDDAATAQLFSAVEKTGVDEARAKRCAP